MSISNYAENKLLDTLRGTAFSVSNAYLKLHTGDPGEDATANAATEATRKAVSFSAASSGGNNLWSGALASSAALTAGDTFQITSLTITLD